MLIDINGLGELARVEAAEGGEIRVGALTRYHSLERDSRFLTDCPLFADALPHIAHPQIRNRGTIGGNLSHADPASELPAIAVAMRARMRIKSAKRERQIAASEFFQGLLTTDIQVDEMLEVAFPVQPARTGHCFLEVARRRGDFALAGVTASVTADALGRCSRMRLALCGVGETPATASLIGQPCTVEAIEAVAAEVQSMIAPSGNVHASPDYQRHIAGVLVQRAISAAHSRVGNAA